MKDRAASLLVYMLTGTVLLLILCPVSVAQQQWEPHPGVSCNKPAHSSSFAKLASKIRKSVVAVVTTGSRDSVDNPGLDQLRRFFPDYYPEHKSLGVGSGFVVRSDGLLVTNEHVIAGAKKVWVLVDGVRRKLPAQVLGADYRSDIALLKIHSPRPLPALAFGNSDSIKVGEWVMTMGNPYGLSHMVSKGIISGKGRALGDLPHGKSRFFDFIQTDAAIHRGNSGGPLIDICGQVVGINTAINANARGIGFAVPGNLVIAVLPHLYEKGRLDRAYLGMNVENVGWELARSFGMDGPKGVVVTHVRSGTPCDKSGLKIGDVILKINGWDVAGRYDLTWKVATLRAGKPADVVVWRNKKSVAIKVVPALRHTHEKTSDHNSLSGTMPLNEKPRLGLNVAMLPIDAAGVAGSKEKAKGVVVIMAEALAAEHGLRLGDVIVEVNGETLESPGQLYESLRKVKTGQMIRFYILRQRVGRFVALRKTWED